MKKYDIIVIGGGGGTKFVRPALAAQKTIAVIEKEDLGGTCLNRGCIPSKMLIHPANVLTAAREMEKYSITQTGEFAVDFGALVSRVTTTVVDESASIVEKYNSTEGVDFYHGEAVFVSDTVVSVNDEEITAESLVIAVGARPSVPPIPGLEGTPYMTSREALRNEKLPEKLLVIGGGYIGCELGHAYGALGAQTVFFVRGSYLEREDETIREVFQGAFEKKHATHYGTKDLSVAYADGIFTITGVNPDGSDLSETGDALLVATGVAPNTDGLGLENTNIQTNERGYVKVDDHMMSDAPGVYAIGDCVGNYMFRHSVNFEAEYLLGQIVVTSHKSKVKKTAIQYPAMPHAVFTGPEIAGVGPTEQELRADGADYLSATHEYTRSAQGMARLPEVGLVKLIFARDTQKLLSAHIIGEEAATMVHQLVLGVTMGATLDDLLRMIYIHPALPEIVRNAARTAKKELSQGR